LKPPSGNMKIKVLQSFKEKLNHQMDYIARDKPRAARKFKTDILQRIKEIPQMPYKNRKSIYFDRDDIRDLIYKGYTVVYKINKNEDSIEVFGFTKYENNPFED
jgi:plasmid stabilization system protein ParE